MRKPWFCWLAFALCQICTLFACCVQDSIRLVKDLFRDKESTEFIIATIPTVLGINESSRLIRALNKERIPCKRIVVNQIVQEHMGTRCAIRLSESHMWLLRCSDCRSVLYRFIADARSMLKRFRVCFTSCSSEICLQVYRDEVERPGASSPTSE